MHQSAAMLLTPPGVGAIAVVMLRGQAVSAFLARCFSRPCVEGRSTLGVLRDGEREIDECLAVLLANHHAELHLHGSPWIVRQALELAGREGFSVVDDPVEAFDGPIIEREMQAWLGRARTALALRVLLAQQDAWRTINAESARRALFDRSLFHLLNPPRIAIVGLPNVGKSTLANQLFGQARSITADIPGTTRDWVGGIADINGLAVMLVDTPGLRHTSDDIERQAIERSRGQVEQADCVIVVLDAAQPFDPLQGPVLAQHPGAIVVINKADCHNRLTALPGSIHTVATTGAGVDDLRRAIVTYFNCDSIDINQPRWWTERQRDELEAICRAPASCA